MLKMIFNRVVSFLTPRGRLVDVEMVHVTVFQEKLGMQVPDSPQAELDNDLMHERIKLMREELDEFIDAWRENDVPGMADALVDLVYVAKGSASLMGLPWEELWDDVHRANMAKQAARTDRARHDAVKPPDWRGPQTEAILRAAGWEG